MREWDCVQVSVGALACCVFWVLGCAVVAAAMVGMVPIEWAAGGQLLAMVGCLRMVLRAIRQQQTQLRDAFDLGREAGVLRPIRGD